VRFLFRTGLATGVIAVVLALASVSWIGYSARSSCADVGRSANPRQVAPDAERPMLVDEILPEYQLGEKHSVFIEASPERIFESLKRVTSDEQPKSRLMNLLPVVMGKREAPSEESLYEMLRDESGLVLEEPNRELVTANIATADEHTPSTPDTVRGFVAYRLRHNEMKNAVNIRVDPVGGGSRLTTETRMMFADRRSCHDFGWYYGVIYPGSSLIRVDILEAVKRRAESTNRATPDGVGMALSSDGRNECPGTA
jgi:hypothetical protein